MFAVKKNTFVIWCAGTLHGQKDFDPFVGQGSQGCVVPMAGFSLFFIKFLGPSALMSRLLGKQLQSTSCEFPAAPSEMDHIRFSAGLGYRRSAHQGTGLGAIKLIWVTTQACQQRRGQNWSGTGQRTDPVCLRKFIQIPGDLLVAFGNFRFKHSDAADQKANSRFFSFLEMFGHRQNRLFEG